MFSIEDYNYDLPDKLIAQKPVDERDHSRLLVLDRNTGKIEHCMFYELPDFFLPSDVLVINNTKVIPGRLIGEKETGGRVELLIIDYASGGRPNGINGSFNCDCILKSSKRPNEGAKLFFGERLTAEILNSKNNIYRISFSYEGEFEKILDDIGQIPLPPYIKRKNGQTPCNDRESYQTVYASHKGAVAAPTAGFHFTKDTLAALRMKGVIILDITLHVGYGTFLPVRVADIRDHQMHPEWFSISEATAETISQAKDQGSRIIAVGTTCVRTLEYAADTNSRMKSGSGQCDLFIYPGYRFVTVDAMVTNFHLPKSTLLMLVSAFAGRENVLKAYQAAIEKQYRFYSYGDAMLII